MAMRRFESYRAAARFAQRQAKSSRTTSMVVREGGHWIVGSHAEIVDEREAKADAERRRIGRERMRAEIEESRERIEYLAARAEHYAALGADDLDALWEDRRSLDVDLTELYLIWQALKTKKGVDI